MTVREHKVLIGITKSNFGGAQRYVLDLASALKAQNVDITVACGGDGMLVDKLHTAGVRVIGIRAFGRDVKVLSDIVSFFTLLRILHHKRPDIFHVNSSKMGLLGALAGRIYGVPRIIFTAHGWAFNEPRVWFVRFFFYLLSCTIVLLAHCTIAVSSAVARDIGRFAFIRRRVTVVRNGIDTPAFLDRATARRALAEKSTGLSDGLWVGTVAELHPVKGLRQAMRGFGAFFSTHKNAQYIVIGEGELRNKLEHEIKKNGLEQHVHLVGFVDDAAAYMQAFDMFLLPSLSEALNYAVLEAGTAGLPVIATSVGGMPEVIEHEKNGLLIEPNDENAIAHALRALADNAEKRHALGEALRTRVRDAFSLTRMVAETMRVYDLSIRQ